MYHGLVVLWLFVASLLPKHSVLGDATTSATNVLDATITRYPSPSPKPTLTTYEKPLIPYLTKSPINTELRTITPSSEQKPSRSTDQFDEKEINSSLSANLKEKLTQEKLKRCQEVESKINEEANKGITSLTIVYASMSGVFLGVDTYYKNALLPAGKTIDNYTSLYATVHTKQQAFLTSLESAKNAIASFSCTGNAPGLEMATFKQDLQQAIKSIKELRDAIKTFIITVKNDAETVNDSGSQASESAN